MKKYSAIPLLRTTFTLLLFAYFVSCSKKEIDIPDTILPPDSMVSVLSDIHIAQAAVGLQSVSDTPRKSLSDYTPAIFRIHQTTAEKFDSSLKFYSSNPELLDSIYKEVIEELNRMQSETEIHRNSPPPKDLLH